MIKTKALSSAATLGLVAMLFAGCGDGDNTKTNICKANESTCLAQGNAGRVCTDDGTELVDFRCADGETCSEGACLAECSKGDQACSGPSLNRICSDDGDRWVPVPCAAGTACVEGDGCVPSDEGVDLCTPDEKKCANDTTVKACDADGDGWVYTTCEAGQSCEDGACVYGEDTACKPRSTVCVDATTSAVCRPDGSGWQITECEAAAPCNDGRCGTGCVEGETKCDEPNSQNILSAYSTYYGFYEIPPVDFRVLYTCVDGEWELSHCSAGKICAYDNIHQSEVDAWVDGVATWFGSEGNASFPSIDTSDSIASCVTPECDLPSSYYGLLWNYDGFYGGGSSLNYFGQTNELGLDVYQCGNATDPKVNPTKAYSVCEGLPPFRNLQWETTTCTGATTCSIQTKVGPFGPHEVPTCSSDCVPGEVRCTSELGSGTQTCLDNGTWGEVDACPLLEYDGKEAYLGLCVPGFFGPGKDSCVDPICGFWDYNNANFYGSLPTEQGVGACDNSGKFWACDPETGLLEEPTDCDPGSCQALGSFLTGGLSIGFCATECQDGQQQCFSDSTYRTCVDGKWSVELTTCKSGSCFNTVNDDGVGTTACGECVAGQTACNELGQIRTCNNQNKWGAFGDCAFGSCQSSGDGHAFCLSQCLDGQKQCSSTGAFQTCEDGLWSLPEACDTGTYCRADSKNVTYACVECLGTKTNGNSNGVVDSYCDASGDLVTCGANNTWGNPVECSVTCVGTSGEPAGNQALAYCSNTPPAPPPPPPPVEAVQ